MITHFLSSTSLRSPSNSIKILPLYALYTLLLLVMSAIPISILILPDMRIQTPYYKLPLPNAIDQWLLTNNVDTVNNVFPPPNHHMGDLPSDYVLCTLQIGTTIVI